VVSLYLSIISPFSLLAATIRWMNQNSAQTKDFVVGSYVFDNPKGLRKFPYSVNKATNPLTYGSLQKLNEVHGWFLNYYFLFNDSYF
jgi:hypothetical protein